MGAIAPVRCAERRDLSIEPACGTAARWRRVERTSGRVTFYCDRHRLATDEPITSGTLIRRVIVTCDVEFTAVTLAAPAAELEARERLESAIYAALGKVDVAAVTSTVERISDARRPATERGGRD